MKENTTHLIDDRYSFKDIVNIDHLREVLEKFSAATGFTTGLVSYPDQELLIGTGWRDICKKFHRAYPDSEKHCKVSNKYLTEKLIELKQFNIRHCENGLIDGATPVIIEGKHVANLFTGQILFEKPDLQQFKNQALAYGYDCDEYLQALEKVPVVTQERFFSALSFLGEIALMVAELGLKNLKLKKNEEKFRAIFYQTYQFLGLLTPEGILIEANKTALSFASINEADVLGRLFWETPWWTHSKYLQEQVREAVGKAASGELASFASSHPGPDGSLHYLDVSIKPVKDEEGNVILLVPEGHDITERTQVEELVKAERDLGIKLSQATSLEEVLNLCLESAIWISGMDCGGVYLVDELNGNINLAAQAGLTDKYLKCVSQYSADSSNTRLIMKGEPIYTHYQELVVHLGDEHQIEGLKAIAVIPIRYQYRVVACLNVASYTMEDVPEFSRTTLETIASHIGASIMHAKRGEDIRHSQQNLDTLFNTVKDFLFILNMEGKIIHTNSIVKERLGYTGSTLVGESVMKVFPQELHEEAMATTAAMLTGQADTCLIPLKTNSGTLIPVETKVTKGKWGGEDVLFGISRDITQRRKSEEELRHLRNYLSNIIDSMPSVLVGVDIDGRVTQWNRQAQKETGIEPESAVGRKLEEVFPRLAADMDKIKTAMRERRVQRDPKKPFQHDRSTRYESITIYPLVSDGIEGAVIRIDDVTRQIHIEEMMIQSEKMLSVGGLAAGMAHEINNPLAGMMQNATVLIDRLTGDLAVNRRAAAECGTEMDTIRAFMEKRGIIKLLNLIHESGCRAANIVQNMLSFSRKSDSKATPNNLADLLDKTVKLAENDYDLKKKFDFRQIHIIRQYEPDMPVVLCEASKIQQVFLNLLKNGAEAMSEDWHKRGKKVPKIEKPMFVLRLSKEGNMARVEIEDNGPGMDDATRKRVFEPFFTTKRVGAGTGLGLSVSYFIITENHGGTMRVESMPTRGTKFVIRLPIK